MMPPRHLLAIMSLLVGFLSLSAQPEWRRDSVWYDQGVPVTTEFEPNTRYYIPSYTENGQPSEVIITRLNEFGIWENLRRRQMAYEGNDLSSLLVQGWNESSQQWVDRMLRLFLYDNEGRLAQRMVQTADMAGASLENTERWSYSYLANGEEEQILYQQWENGDWQNKRRQQFTYNAQGELASQTLEVWNNGSNNWLGLFRRMWDYEPNAMNPMQITTQQWENGDWQNVSRRLLFYNNAGFWLGATFQEWESGSGSWVNQSRELYQVNGQNQNRMDNLLFQLWDGAQWNSVVRESSSINGLSVSTVVEQRDSVSGNWEKIKRYGALFSPDGRIQVDVRNQVWDETVQDWLNNSNTQRYVHFWSSTMVSATELEKADLICKAPNPYQPGMPIFCESILPGQPLEIRLFDLLGRLVYQGETNVPQRFSLDVALPSGTYLLHLSQGAQMRQAQLLIVSN